MKLGGTNKLSISKLRDRDDLSINKTSPHKEHETNLTHSSNEGESEESEVFVRTKAAAHPEMSVDEPLGESYETMKHNDQTILASV